MELSPVLESDDDFGGKPDKRLEPRLGERNANACFGKFFSVSGLVGNASLRHVEVSHETAEGKLEYIGNGKQPDGGAQTVAFGIKQFSGRVTNCCQGTFVENFRIGAKNRFESGEVVAEIPFRFFEEEKETGIHFACGLSGFAAKTHDRPVAAENFFFANIRCGKGESARFVLSEKIRLEQNSDCVDDSLFFHDETGDGTGVRMSHKAGFYIFCPIRVKLQIHVAKDLNFGRHGA